jgi:hypothetical protein
VLEHSNIKQTQKRSNRQRTGGAAGDGRATAVADWSVAGFIAVTAADPELCVGYCGRNKNIGWFIAGQQKHDMVGRAQNNNIWA